jgi:hypothetical protein
LKRVEGSTSFPCLHFFFFSFFPADNKTSKEKNPGHKGIARLSIMTIPVVEFSKEEYKIRKVFGSKSTVVK